MVGQYLSKIENLIKEQRQENLSSQSLRNKSVEIEKVNIKPLVDNSTFNLHNRVEDEFINELKKFVIS